MKKILVFFLLLGAALQSQAQYSIRRSSTNPAAVDILFTPPPAGVGLHSVSFFEFALQVPNPLGAGLTAAWVPTAALGGSTMTYDFQTGTDYNNTTFVWYTNSAPSNQFYNFPSGETVLGTVTFSGPGAAGAIVNAIDYQNQTPYGGNTDVAVWVLWINDLGLDPTNYSSLFYQSAASGATPGSTAPYTTNDGGVVNQGIAIVNTPLPVVLTSFDAQVQEGCKVGLHWTIAQEKEFSHYLVQYSTDGSIFGTIGKVDAKGLPEQTTYSFDHTKISGNAFYRLQMVDVDGKSAYSKVLTVNSSCTHSRVFNIFPNPTESTFTVKGSLIGEDIQVYNSLGQLVHRMKVSDADNKVDLSALVDGVYNVVVVNGAQRVFSAHIVKK